jgi:hypothetical protein
MDMRGWKVGNCRVNDLLFSVLIVNDRDIMILK